MIKKFVRTYKLETKIRQNIIADRKLMTMINILC